MTVSWADVLRAEADAHRAELRRVEVRLAYHLQKQTERDAKEAEVAALRASWDRADHPFAKPLDAHEPGVD